MEQWPQVKEIFHAALEREASERGTFLVAVCRGDTGLRAEVERLLTAHVQAAGFIEPPLIAPKSAAIEAGRQIGRYEIGRLLGAGGMGEVYVARDVELGRDVAVKVATGGDADAHARLKREAQHASQLNHPHICTIHEVGAHDGQPFIAMEYVAGARLADLIPPDGLPLELLLRYGVQMADAVAHAHGHGVIHRDLKSANIVVTPDGRVKILDFGLARRFSRDNLKQLSESRVSVATEAGMAGTLSCMAPELLRGEPASERSDIWALGVLLYEMATGGRPFAGATGFELSAAILHDSPAPLSSRIPAAVQEVIRRCLAKDPRERYEQASEIRAALEKVPPGAGPVKIARWRVVAVIAGLAVTIALSAGWYWLHPAGKSPPVAAGAFGRPAIAVMTFETVGAAKDADNAWLSSGVPTMLLTGLAQTRGLDIVSTERLTDALKRHGGSSLASLDKSQAADVARQAGAGTVVFGSIFHAGPEIRIDVQLEDLSTGRVLVAQSVHGTDLFALVDQLASRIRDGVGFRAAPDIRGVADVSTSSLEAYRLYSLGLEAFHNFRMDEAQSHFESAVVLDPGFAEAYQQLARVMGFRQVPELQREYLRKAEGHADRLSERRRLLLKLQLAHAVGSAGDEGNVLDELVAKYPDLADSYLSASLLYSPGPDDPGNVPKLLQILSTGITVLPSSDELRNLYGYALINAYRYADAIRELETYVRLAPREPNPYDSLGEGYLLAGAADKAVEAYSRALAIDPKFEGGHDGQAVSLAALGRYDAALVGGRQPSVRAFILSRVGRYKEAEEAITVGVQQAMRDDDSAEHAWLLLTSSLFAIERREYAQALRSIESAERTIAAVPEGKRRAHLRLGEFLSGMAQLGAGRINLAREHFALERRMGEPASMVEEWWSGAFAGEIALAGGDLQGATAAFSAAEPSPRMWFAMIRGTVSLLANDLPSRDGLARVAKARGDLAGAIRIYRGLLVYGPDQKWVAPFEPRYVLEIARLLEQSGDKRSARLEYERFLGFWKGADAGLPELAEARQALVRMR